METALITGGSGFIGRHFAQHLLDNTDWRLVILDSLNYAADTALTPLGERVSLFYHDLRSPIPEALKERIGSVDYFFNLASSSHVDRSIADPVPFVMNNVSLVLNALEYAREVRPKLFLHVGTDEQFGPAPDGVFFKEWDRELPSNPYAASKSSQAAICISYWRTYGLPIILTNAMNNFGEGQNSEKYIPKAIRHLLRGEPVPVHGGLFEGKWEAGSRVWLHARNHADALLFIAKNVKPTLYPAADRPDKFNVAGDRELSNMDIVFRLAHLLCVKPLYRWENFHETRPGHDMRYGLDGGKLRELGWVPPLDLEESFNRTVDWYREQAG